MTETEKELLIKKLDRETVYKNSDDEYDAGYVAGIESAMQIVTDTYNELKNGGIQNG